MKKLLIAILLLTPLILVIEGVGPAMAETPQQTVARANQLANADKYPEAIALYEQVLKQLPNQQTLKDNLAALYVNHGVQLQNNKQYDAADQQFDKALKLIPREKHAMEGKAATNFYKAMDLKDAIRNGTAPPDWASVHVLLDLAVGFNPSETAFKKAKANIYAEEAYALADQKKYAEAEAPLLKALALEPNDPGLKSSLANVYLGHAQQAATDEERDALIAKALATDNSPRVQETAARMSQPAAAPAADDQAFSQMNAGGQFTGKAVKQRPTSIQDMLLDIENQLGIVRDEKATLMQRLESAEKQVLGTTQEGPIGPRADRLYESLLGSSTGMATTDTQQTTVSSEHSYLDKIFEVTDGRVVRWGKFPLRVYIEDLDGNDDDKTQKETEKKKPMEPRDYVDDGMKLPEEPEEKTEKDRKASVKDLYSDDYRQAVIDALDAWKTATDGFTNYVVVKNAWSADVQFLWDLDYTDEFANPETTPDVYRNYTPPSAKQKNIMRVLQVASMFTPGLFSLAPQALGAGLQYQQNRKLDVIRDESKVKLGLRPVQDLDPEQAKTLIRNMASKEFAHVLGLKAASPRPGDITYPELRSDIVQEPSNRDLQTLRDLYSRPPNIILNVQ